MQQVPRVYIVMPNHVYPIRNCLRRYRKDRGISQRQVAHLLGISNTSMISRWEKGRCFPSLVNLFRLAAVYSTMVDALYWDLRVSIRREMQRADQDASSTPAAQ